MKNFVIFLVFYSLVFSSCKNSKKDVEVVVDASVVISQMQAGIGVNFTNLVDSFPVVQLEHQYRSYGGSCWGANPPLSDTASWQKIWNYADWLGFDFARLLTTRNMYEPERGLNTYESTSMKMLYHYLGYCQSPNVSLFLKIFNNNGEWLAVPDAKGNSVRVLQSAPNNIELYTQGMIDLLKYLVNEKGYSCIKYFCITNEPFENWSWYIGKFNPDTYESPVAAYKLMSEKLKASGLAVKLSGPDVSIYSSSKIHPERNEFFEHFGAYDIHSYVTRFVYDKDSVMLFEDGGIGEVNRIVDTEKQYAEWKNHGKENGNKPFFITEMGSFKYGFGEDTIGMSTYPALLKDVQSVLRYSNIGLDGFMRWSFLNRGNLDGQWQFVNTWDMKKNTFLPADNIKPQNVPFFMWGMLSRFVPKYATILKTSVDGGVIDGYKRVFTAAYMSPENNNISIFILNDSEKEISSTINLHAVNGKTFYKYVINEPGISKSDFELNPIDSIAINTSEIQCNIGSKSLILFSTYKLTAKENGIIKD